MKRGAWRLAASAACVCCACKSPVAPAKPSSAPTSTSTASASASSAALAPTAVAALAHNVLPGLDVSRFLAAMSLERSTKLEPGTLELVAPNYAGSNLGELDARHLVLRRSAEGRILVRLTFPNYAASLLPVKARESQCSFVADCDEPVVLRVESELKKAHPSPSANDVVQFVDRFIDHKHMARGFDIASVVAQKREGDCTEHAVLTAALLRASGIPSHIVTGVVLVEVSGTLLAFGHAWAEFHDGKGWQLADATNASEPPQPMAYVPLRVMQNEGPAYARDEMTGFDALDITAVAVPQSLSLSAPPH